MSKFDFFGVSDEGTSKMTIISPVTGEAYVDAEGNEAFIEIAHLTGPEGRAFDIANKRKAAKMKEIPGLSLADTYLVNKCAALTKSWLLIGHDGVVSDLPCTPENVVELYSNPNQWLIRQVVAHASTYANFTKASSTN